MSESDKPEINANLNLYIYIHIHIHINIYGVPHGSAFFDLMYAVG